MESSREGRRGPLKENSVRSYTIPIRNTLSYKEMRFLTRYCWISKILDQIFLLFIILFLLKVVFDSEFLTRDFYFL